jgi:GxxExxY protein
VRGGARREYAVLANPDARQRCSRCHIRWQTASFFTHIALDAPLLLSMIMDLDDITEAIIGCAIELHRQYGPGLLESVYKRCLAIDLVARGFEVAMEEPVALTHQGMHMPRAFVIDLFVNRRVIVEVKCVAAVGPLHEAQLRTYLKLTRTQVGLIINFNVPLLVRGVHRVVNNYQEPKRRRG